VAAATAFVGAGGAAAASRPGSAGAFPVEAEQPRSPRAARRRQADPGHVEQVRAQGGTVVATGGCFDLLHAGHVQTLKAARALGDCLVVCLNSDASVARLKGPSARWSRARPRCGAARPGLRRRGGALRGGHAGRPPRALRPDVWVKGGDYAAAELPEAPVLARWGGRAVILPFVEGRSTTRLIARARLRAV
jgi:cytidyltransferase-like protein